MSWLAPLRARWQQTSRREQLALLGGATLLMLAMLWLLAVAPALAILRGAGPQRLALETQLQQMQGLQSQAKALQAQPRLAPDEARRLLEASVKPLAPSLQIAAAGDRATVTLKGMTADALTQWLAQVRLNVRVLPAEARLRRNAAGTWDGTLVLNLGAP
jgi:general secretion pathway protein M